MRRLLRETWNRRCLDDDPHVLLSPNSRRPVDQPRLSKLVRTALIRGGIEHVGLGDLCRQERREVDNARLLELAESQDAITRRDAMSLLNLSEAAAYERLRQLTVQGLSLIHISLPTTLNHTDGNRLFPVGDPPLPLQAKQIAKDRCALFKQDLLPQGELIAVHETASSKHIDYISASYHKSVRVTIQTATVHFKSRAA